MKCKLCGKEITRRIKLKGGSICQECYNQLPDSAKHVIRSVSPKQIKQLQALIHQQTERAPISINWLRIFPNAIGIQNWKINLSDIKHISLNFHPTAPGFTSGSCIGWITIIIETRKPHFLIEERISDHEHVANYEIIGKNILYKCHPILAKLVQDIQNAVVNNQDDLATLIENFKKENQKQQQTKNNSHRNQGPKNQQNKNQQNKSQHYKTDPLLDQAIKMYGLQRPFTKEQLIQRKRKLIQCYHPDMNQDRAEFATEMTIKILENYELLLNYVGK